MVAQAPVLRAAVVFFLLAACGICGAAERAFTVLAVNDVYRVEGVDQGAGGGLPRLRTLRRELQAADPGLLVLHAGDMFFPSMLSRRYNGAQMIDVLNRLDGDAAAFDSRLFATFGNHEFDKDKARHAAIVRDRVAESQFTWLSANVEFARGGSGAPVVNAQHLRPTALIEANGIKVGIFGVTIDSKVPEYVRRIGDPIEAARRATRSLREQGAEVVIALTHLSMRQDRELLERLGAEGPDVVFGGHEHFRQAGRVGTRYVLKADADARTATVARIVVSDATTPRVRVEYSFRHLDREIAEDIETRAVVDKWLARFDREQCAAASLPAGCLSAPLGRTAVTLVAEELQIRSIETNLGNWVADRALDAFRDRGAQVAFVNAGSLRLNQDLPAGTMLTRGHLAELFAYPSPMFLVRMDGATLQRVVEHAVTDWPGSGRWLQIAGFAFRYDSAAGTVSDLTLIGAGRARRVGADEEILAVVPNFLLDGSIGDQDGYTMLGRDMILPTDGQAPDLVDLVRAALERSGEDGIAPRVEGRVCSVAEGPGAPCLAISAGVAAP
jgi:2',3'-cyclic-nucleotide 2'-phosphodiesterase (5'-nucleotidase family)